MRRGAAVAVLCGGMFGTAARSGLESIIPAPGGWPLPTLLINLTGAFLLGVVLEAVLRRGPDEGRLRLIRLAAGTGFMGAFTTYSTLALDAVQLSAKQEYIGATLYLMMSLLCGILASAAGIWAASTHHRRADLRSKSRVVPASPGGTTNREIKTDNGITERKR